MYRYIGRLLRVDRIVRSYQQKSFIYLSLKNGNILYELVCYKNDEFKI